MNFEKQSALFNQKNNKYGVTIFGVGSIGSWLAYALAKTGFNNITVIDSDTIELSNVPAQFYGIEDEGKLKVKALAERIKADTGVKVRYINAAVNKDFKLVPEPNMIYFCGFDSLVGTKELYGRKLLFDRLKAYPIIWGEARIGRFEMRYYFVDTKDKEWVKEYEESFNGLGHTELKCGEKCLCSVNMHLVSEITMNIMRISEGEKYNTLYMRNLKSFDTIHRLKG